MDLELDSPEMKIKEYNFKSNSEHYFARASSETKDPGVLGPIVWDLKRKQAVEGNIHHIMLIFISERNGNLLWMLQDMD